MHSAKGLTNADLHSNSFIREVIKIIALKAFRRTEAENGLRLGADIDEVMASIASGTFDTRPFNRNRLLPPFSRDLRQFQVGYISGFNSIVFIAFYRFLLLKHSVFHSSMI